MKGTRLRPAALVWLLALFFAACPSVFADVAWQAVTATKAFGRASTAIDPRTGTVAASGAEITDRLLHVRFNSATGGVRKLTDAYNVMWRSPAGVLFATPTAATEANSGKLYKSTNGGQSWTLVNDFGSGGGASALQRMFALEAGGQRLLFLSAFINPNRVVYCSKDDGLTWSANFWPAGALGLPFWQGDVLLEDIAGSSPTNNKVLFVEYGTRYSTTSGGGGGLRLYRSTQTFAALAAGTAPTVEIVFKPDVPALLETSLRADASAGATSVSFDTILWSGFSVTIGYGLGTAETKTISANSLNVATISALANSHTAGETVRFVPTDLYGMHFHSAKWVKRDSDGGENTLILSYGDRNLSRVMFRIPNASALVGAGVGNDPASVNYSSAYIWNRLFQPVGMALVGTSLAFVNDRGEGEVCQCGTGAAFLASPLFWDNYDLTAGLGFALDLTAAGSYWLVSRDVAPPALTEYSVDILTDLSLKGRSTRLFRQTTPVSNAGLKYISGSGDGTCVGYTTVAENPGSYVFDPFTVTPYTATQVSGAVSNLVTAANFAGTLGVGQTPTGWTKVGGGTIELASGGFGGGNFVRLTSTAYTDAPEIISAAPYYPVSPSTVYNISVRYRVAVPPDKDASAGTETHSIQVQWRDGAGAFISQPGASVAAPSDMVGEWLTRHFTVTSPSNAAGARVRLIAPYKAIGTVDFAMPQITLSSANLPPALTTRAADSLTYSTTSAAWAGLGSGRTRFLWSPDVPTSVSRTGTETVFTAEAWSGERLALRWTYASGFVASLTDSAGLTLGQMNLGTMRLHPRDTAEIALAYVGGTGFSLSIATPSETVSATLPPLSAAFNVKSLRLGGDLWDGAQAGYGGRYYFEDVSGAASTVPPVWSPGLANAAVSLRRGERRTITASWKASSGTHTIATTPAPAVTLFSKAGTAVSGLTAVAATGYDTTAGASVRAWYLLDTTGLARGTYSLTFAATVTESGVSNVRQYAVLVKVD